MAEYIRFLLIVPLIILSSFTENHDRKIGDECRFSALADFAPSKEEKPSPRALAEGISRAARSEPRCELLAHGASYFAGLSYISSLQAWSWEKTYFRFAIPIAIIWPFFLVIRIIYFLFSRLFFGRSRSAVI